MGVHGLWKLIEPSGKPVPLESLENKVLAVDVSIWLHQAVKGFQDSKGAPLPNAHLLGIYHRVCKLLYFRVKPIFIFDGGVPVLKKETIAKRNQQKSKNQSDSDRLHKQLLNTILKHTALNKVLSEKTKATITSPTKKLLPSIKNVDENIDDLYQLPPSTQQIMMANESDDSMSDDNNDESIRSETTTTDNDSIILPNKQWDLHSIDTQSTHFKALPVDVRHDILTDLKETRKQSSWGRLHELPTQSDDFSDFQMKRLLKRQSIQSALEDAEKEMGGHSLSLAELELLLNDQGVLTTMNHSIGNRIASDENTRYLLIKDIKRAIELAKNAEELLLSEQTSDDAAIDGNNDDELEQAIALSLQDMPSTSLTTKEVVTPVPSTSYSHDSLPSTSEDRLASDAILHKVPSSSLQSLHNNPPSSSSCSQTLPEGFKESTTQKDIACTSTISESNSLIENYTDDVDFESEDSSEELGPSGQRNNNKFSSAQSYMMYSGLTPNEIAKIIDTRSSSSIDKAKLPKNANKSIPEDLVEIMSNSDSSDEFVDVPKDNEKAIEIVINPDEISAETDDLFGDIFKDDPSKSSGMDPSKILDTDDEAPILVEPLKSLKDKVQKSFDIVTEQTSQTVVQELIKDYTSKSTMEENDKTTATLSLDQMVEMKTNLRQEQMDLIVEKSVKERMAGNITDQMYQEAQELLELFGVPYLIAPMEAEAQCAFLNEHNLTDGTITDDSDIWLFGGKTVYKNFFSHGKHVMEFQVEDIQHHFKLSREQMILLALLVGSDYTTGLQGIGPVTALEILAAFPPSSVINTAELLNSLTQTQLISGLAEFKSWFNQGKLPGLGGRTSLRGKLKNVIVSEHFPSTKVVNAYLEPKVDTNTKDKFTWAKPDVVGLIEFAQQKFGWSRKKSEDILNPVMKRQQDSFTQKKIRDYFKTRYKVDQSSSSGLEATGVNIMSKRVRIAVNKIAKGCSVDEPDLDEVKPRKQRVTKKNVKKKTVEKELDEDVAVLKQTEAISVKRVKEIETELQDRLQQDKPNSTAVVRKILPDLHKKDVILQKKRDENVMLKRKLKAIEVFRKSKQGPGFVKAQKNVPRKRLKEDAGLSESSSSNDE